MKRYEQGSVGMRPDPEGAWCDYNEIKGEIERLRGLLREVLLNSSGLAQSLRGRPMPVDLLRRVSEALGNE